MYEQFVEVGRVCTVTYGPLVDSCAVVTDVVDDKRVLIDLPGTTNPRQIISVKRLEPTSIKLEALPRAADPNVVESCVVSEGILQRWAQEPSVKPRLVEKGRLNANDFQRFKHGKLLAKRDALAGSVRG